MKKFINTSLIVFILVFSNLFAQDGYVKSFDGSDVPLIKEPTNFAPKDNVPIFNRDPRKITDEYGSQSVNRALYLGSGSPIKRVEVPHHYDFEITMYGTIEMWVYPTDLSHHNIIVSKGGSLSTQTSYYIGLTSNLFTFRIGDKFFNSYASIPINEWTHLAVTWSLINYSYYEVRKYINGNFDAFIVGSAAMNTSNTKPLVIGGSVAWPLEWFEGYIDEVRLWHEERTLEEIRSCRFVGLGDFADANTGNALLNSSFYNYLISSWTFNFAGSAFAYDDISQHHGTYMGGASVAATLAGQPIPYNLVLKCDEYLWSYVKIPHNNIVFNRVIHGSFEAWIYLTDINTFQPIFQKGTSFENTTLAVYVTAGNKFGINIGPHNYISNGHTFSALKWYHVCATWTGGPNFTVKLYVNGVLDATQNYFGAMPDNTNEAYIGMYYDMDKFKGYIDEVRIWDPALTQEQIKNNMLISGRALLPNAQLLACWSFDGHLGNWSAITGINAEFRLHGYCRLSGYANEEATGGAYNDDFDAHTTVLNGVYVNQAYFRGKSGLEIPDPGYVQDTIKVTKWPSNVTTVHVLMSIQHKRCEDLDIRITAPNGQTRDISTDNGGNSYNGYLTIFYDAHTEPVTSSTFLTPWSNNVKPEVFMGNFGGSPINGNWILRITDDNAGYGGTLMGWGLRFNNSVINVSQISLNVPGEYKLHQNYPNPFNPVTNIIFDIPKAGIVNIKVYDITGREVCSLVNQSMEAGSYNVDFDASHYSSGTYFYKIQAGDFTDVKKMMLVK